MVYVPRLAAPGFCGQRSSLQGFMPMPELAKNRKAYHDFHVLDKLEAGYAAHNMPFPELGGP